MSLRHLPLRYRLSPLSPLSPLTQITHQPHHTPIPHPRPLSSTPHPSRMAKVPPHRNSFAEVRFTASDVPPLDFWERLARPPLITPDLAPTLTASAIADAATRYAALALENAPGWRTHLHRHQLSPHALHAAAAMILTGGGSRTFYLALHILHTLTGAGYAPATLTTARLALRTRGTPLSSPQFAGAREGLERLWRRRESADACTLMGLVYAAGNTPEDERSALQCFRAAREVDDVKGVHARGKARGEEWQWKASALLHMGRIYLRRGQREKAEMAFREGVCELDNAEACYCYATLLAEDDPQRVGLLEKAAMSGVVEAARELGRLELKRVDEEGLSKTEKLDRQVLADEWLGVAGDKALI
ncbi:hypothetical protein F5B20DRAFT_596652 [Whalleya microplaca]|nr:hypothetical protein F5B20DRAFT_596652 [Whalleya microplaca]